VIHGLHYTNINKSGCILDLFNSACVPVVFRYMYRIDIFRSIRDYRIGLYQEVVEKMITNSEILKFICDKPATVEEIAKHFGLKTRTARYRILQLKAQNKLREYINFKDMRRINYISVDATILIR